MMTKRAVPFSSCALEEFELHAPLITLKYLTVNAGERREFEEMFSHRVECTAHPTFFYHNYPFLALYWGSFGGEMEDST